MKKRMVAILLFVTILLVPSAQAVSVSQGEIDNIDNINAAGDNLIVVVPGIVGSELVDIDNIKVWVGIGLLAGKIECNEVGNPIYPTRAYNDDNYGALDTYKTLYDRLNNTYSNRADVKFFAYDWRKTNTVSGQLLKNLVSKYSGKIIIVAHSMGGIVASEYLRIATPSQRNRTTLITLGTPFTGAPKAVQVMEDGKMFPGIAGDITGSYVQNLIRNIPAAYELLPTNRSDPYIQLNGVDQKNVDAWDIMKKRTWANIQSGTGVKPMMSTASAFHSGLMQTNGPHYSLSAGASIFMTSIGYTTVQKVNYTKSGNTYNVSSYVTTNNGDGTVPGSSARNKLPADNAHVVMLSKGGNHTDMVSYPATLTQVDRYVSQALAGYLTMGASEEQVTNDIVENERGWLLGDGLDGKRIRVIIRGSDMPTVLAPDGTSCVLVGDTLYSKNEGVYVGNCWMVSDGYQFEMMNDEYTFSFGDGGDGVVIEVMYMENGYFDKVEMFEMQEAYEEYRLEIGDYGDGEVALTTQSGAVIEQSIVLDEPMLERLNMD